MNLEEGSKIYFIGIGGIAMSAVAGIAAQLGYEVVGSDSKAIYDPAKSVLDKYHIKYFVGYDEGNISASNADIYIASAGEDQSNPEIAWLISRDMPIYSFSQFLAEIMHEKIKVVVTGTHGKSTTTGMLGTILQHIDDSSFMTGAVLSGEETNFHVGDGHYFVVEGDEYKALYDDPTPKFQQYKADVVLLNNLEFDHPDMFANLEELTSEFNLLLESLPSDALAVYNADSPELAKLMHGHNVGQVSFSLHNQSDFIASEIAIHSDYTEFTVSHKNEMEKYQINLFGELNVYNALGCIATLRTLGFSREQIQSGLDNYIGVKRRMEFIGEVNNVKVFDDYAHHPTAIKETLLALKQRFPNAALWAIFEPHTFSRTQAVLPELATAFEPADCVLLAEIYPAREIKNNQTITGQQVVEAISKHHENVHLVADKNAALKYLKENLSGDAVVVVMAVGNFNTLAYDLVK